MPLTNNIQNEIEQGKMMHVDKNFCERSYLVDQCANQLGLIGCSQVGSSSGTSAAFLSTPPLVQHFGSYPTREIYNIMVVFKPNKAISTSLKVQLDNRLTKISSLDDF